MPMTPDPLVSVAELSERLDDPAIRLADVRWYLNEPRRGRSEYDAGHLPGAVFVDLETDLSATTGPGRHPLPDPAVFAKRMGELGFGDEHEVVAYDASGGTVAARLWWMLRWIGHPTVRVLDGGVQAWEAAGQPLSASPQEHPAAVMAVRPSLTRTIDRAALAGSLGEVALVDVRAPERYRGEVEPIDPKAGHIPTARNVPTAENLGGEGRFLPSHLLGARYQAEADGRDLVLYCGSGVNACQAALAVVSAGLPEPTVYPGSWSDWSASDLPIATGPDAGDRP